MARRRPAVQISPDPALIASDLRAVLGQLVRRLRAENRFPIAHAAVLGRLEREGPQSASELAAAERMRPQSMAQVVSDLKQDGLIERRPDPQDRRRALIELTGEGLARLDAVRRERESWLARAIAADLSAEEQVTLEAAVALLQRLAGG
jgi:DNA-binding MarR family transcriptional regulator